ncbi:MAG: VOC family protein [Dehalococcoidia bacterium]|nr:VOC family protein [Dehalococcoidia bacterium]
MHTLRISHPAISGRNAEATIHFYTRVLGMELVLRQPNLDYEPEEHLFFHVGNDNFIAYFVPRPGVDPASYPEAQGGSGHMDHVALDVSLADLPAWEQRLREGGVDYEGPVDRGYERSLYFKDPNNVTVELLAWITEPPAGMPQAAIIKRAQALREARGAAFIEDQDVRRAIAELSP